MHPHVGLVRLVLCHGFDCFEVHTALPSGRPLSLAKPRFRPVFFSDSYPTFDRTRFGFDRIERRIERRRVRSKVSTTVRRGVGRHFHPTKMRGCAWMCASSAPAKQARMEANQPPVPKLNKQVRGWGRKRRPWRRWANQHQA